MLAFMGRATSRAGPFRDILERGKKFLLASTHKDNGFISFSSMYEHGLATLALAEMYGMDPDPELEKTLRKAVDLIIKARSRPRAAGIPASSSQRRLERDRHAELWPCARPTMPRSRCRRP